MSALNPGPSKRCTRCLSEIPLSCFFKKGQRRDSQCKSCVSASKKIKYARTKIKLRSMRKGIRPKLLIHENGKPDNRLLAHRIIEAIFEWQIQGQQKE